MRPTIHMHESINKLLNISRAMCCIIFVDPATGKNSSYSSFTLIIFYFFNYLENRKIPRNLKKLFQHRKLKLGFSVCNEIGKVM